MSGVQGKERREEDWLDDLARRQRLDVVGDLVGGLAHELNNALGVVSGYQDLLLESLDDRSGGLETDEREQLRGRARTVHTWTGTALQSARRLHEMSRLLRDEEQSFDAGAVAVEAAELCRYRCEREGILLLVEAGTGLPEVRGLPGELLQAIVNLVHNAREAIRRSGDGEGTIRVASERLDIDGNVWVRLVVEDDRPGVEDIDEPFRVGVSARQGDGVGLGLPIARRIAERAGGRLTAQAGPGGRFRLDLPAG
jgi:signal transduction histidine kinase